ncbi:MAG: NAD(P)-binding protein [Actinobacteria bacterium]|nr:NAD(P)-binding protein [Actinomycetota bacterium]
MAQMKKRVAVVGAGWSGAVTAERLGAGGIDVEVFERAANVGGHSRAETLNGVVYEPNGAHIFHTSNADVADYVGRFGLSRPYEHCVKAQVHLGDDDALTLLSWPPQLEELQELALWPTIEKELAALPEAPAGEDFETFVMSLMGPTLYNLFIRDYTAKQWGRPATELSSSFAPKRVELRNDGYRRLFRDRWEFFPANGMNSVIEGVLSRSSVTCGVEVLLEDLVGMQGEFDAFVVTAPLDRLLGRDGELEWRGVHLRSRYIPVERPEETSTPAYVVNWPDLRYPFTRTVETKHATGQNVMGTVVSEEYPGAPARHYPVPTVDRRFEALNERYKEEVRSALDRPVYFCGRLANYLYINQDQAIEQGFACSTEVLGDLTGSRS